MLFVFSSLLNINEIIFKKIDSSSKKLMGGFFQVFF